MYLILLIIIMITNTIISLIGNIGAGKSYLIDQIKYKFGENNIVILPESISEWTESFKNENNESIVAESEPEGSKQFAVQARSSA